MNTEKASSPSTIESAPESFCGTAIGLATTCIRSHSQPSAENAGRRLQRSNRTLIQSVRLHRRAITHNSRDREIYTQRHTPGAQSVKRVVATQHQEYSHADSRHQAP